MMRVTDLNELKTAEDYQRLIDAIHHCLCLDPEQDRTVIANTHETYHQAVREINGRLKTCDDLLRQGLRSEALQEAAREPELLDTVAILDFDEQELWDDLAGQCGLVKPEELLVEVADDLQTAWAAEEPLTDLRYRHRLHALARSPLPIRIAILRELARVDQENPLWAEELQTFEKARLDEISNESRAAAREADLSRLRSLDSELQSSEWRTLPPEGLKKSVSDTARKLQREKAREKLSTIAPELTQAFAQLDLAAARSLRESWKDVQAVAQLPESDPLRQEVWPALDWLAKKDQQDKQNAGYAAALAALEAGLNKDITKEELKTLYDRLEQFDRGVAQELQNRVATRVVQFDQLEDQRRRRRLVILSASLAAGCLVLIAGGWWILRALETSDRIAFLGELLESQKLQQAQAEVKTVEEELPYVFENPEYRRLRSDLESQLVGDRDRRERHRQLLETVREYQNSLSADTPETLTNSESRLAREAIEDAKKLSQDPQELRDAETAERELNARIAEVQTSVDRRFLTDVTSFESRLADLDPHREDYLALLNEKAGEATSLKSRPHLSPGLGAKTMDPILSEITALRQADTAAREEAKFLADIRAAIGDAAAYQNALQAYVDHPPLANSARGRQFQELLKDDAKLWTGYDAVQQLQTKLSGKNLATYNPKFAGDLLAEVQGVLKSHPGFPAEKELQQVAKTLTALSARSLTTLEKVLNQGIIQSVLLVELENGKRYYTLKPPQKVGESTYRIEAVSDTELDDTQRIQFDAEEIQNPKRPNREWDFDSPQKVFSRFAKDQVLELSKNMTSWETAFLTLLDELHQQKRMDPFVRFLLIEVITKIAAKGSVYIQNELADDLTTLQKAAAEIQTGINWINPDVPEANTEVAQVRSQAEETLKRLGSLSDALKGLPVYLETLKLDYLAPEYEWFGWLHKDRKDEWTITLKPGTYLDLPDGGSLTVVTRSPQTRKIMFEPIGEFARNRGRVTASSNSPLLKEGRPVYWKKSP